MRLRMLPAVLLLASAITPAVSQSLVVPAEMSELAKEAKAIFAGTVSSTRAEWNACHSTIITRVTFTNLVVVKGAMNPDRAVLAISGGRVGDEEIVTEGQPRFVPGERYILLCNAADLGSERNRYLPIIGLNQGFFRIRSGHRTGSPVVVNGGDQEIVGIEGGQLVVVANPEHTALAERRGRVTDLPFIAERGKPPDPNDPRRKGPQKKSHSCPAPGIPSVPREQVLRAPESDSLQPPDWVPGSQRVVDKGVPTARILDPEADRGTRMTESEFLRELGRLASP